MKWIGLTGGLASGKSTVARLLRTKGYPVIDADALAKQVVARGTPGLNQIVSQFGSHFLQPDGELDRRQLGREIFSNEPARLRLEALIHPLVQQEVQRQKLSYEGQGFSMVFYDVPLLFEKNISGFDAIVVVSAPLDSQRARLKNRDGLSDEEISQRLGAQMPLDEKEKKATYVVANRSTLEALDQQVDELLVQLKSS